MSNKNNFNDFTNLIMNTATKSANDMKNFTESFLSDQVEAVLKKLNVVTREEFEIVEQIAKKALEENEELKNKLEELNK